MTAVLHLINSSKRYAVEQGATFRKVSLLHERDLTAWTAKGEIKNNYDNAGGETLGEFSFEPLEFKTVTICNEPRTRTVIIPFLSSEITEDLGLKWTEAKMTNRQYQREEPIVGKNAWVYDIYVKDAAATEIIRIAQGFIEVDLRVTDV